MTMHRLPFNAPPPGGANRGPKLPPQLAAITTQWEWVDPVKAREFLALSPGNRKESESEIAKFARCVESDNYAPTGQGMSFDDQGRFRDGHHRCLGIIRANKGIWILVTRGVPSANFANVDTGIVRSLPQILGGMGIDGQGIQAPYRTVAILRAFLRLERGLNSSHFKLSPGEALEALEKYGDEIKWALCLKTTAPELASEKVHHVTSDFKVMALSGGMESGRPSVAIVAQLEDGSHVFIETSMRCFLAAAKAFEARFGVETYAEEGGGEGGNRN